LLECAAERYGEGVVGEWRGWCGCFGRGDKDGGEEEEFAWRGRQD